MSCRHCDEDHDWRQRHCSGCGKLHSNSIVFCNTCKDGRTSNLSWPRWLLFLKRMRGLISEGRVLRAVDSDVIGDKELNMTLGACDETKEGWPDAEDHLWPWQFTNEGRVAPRYRMKGQLCPFDRRREIPEEERELLQGCYYTCDYFSPAKIPGTKRRKKPLTDRTEILRRYDEEIAKLEGADGQGWPPSLRHGPGQEAPRRATRVRQDGPEQGQVRAGRAGGSSLQGPDQTVRVHRAEQLRLHLVLRSQ